jgi:antitoxin MazE
MLFSMNTPNGVNVAGARSADIEVRDRNAVLKPQLRRVYRLNDLLKQITKKNVQHEVDSGGPVGRESW